MPRLSRLHSSRDGILLQTSPCLTRSTMERDTYPDAPEARTRRPPAWPAGGAAVLAAALVVLIVEVTAGGWLVDWDERVTAVMVAGRTTSASHVFWVFSLLGNTVSLIVATAVLVVVLLIRGKRAPAMFSVVTMASASGLSYGLKELLARSRPPAAEALIALPESQSLPSGHALMMTVFVGLILLGAVRAWPRAARVVLGVALSVVAACVGVSRVYLGVHWASDVIAGWCLAAIWLTLVFTVFRVWEGSRYAVSDARGMGGVRFRALVAALSVLVWVAVVVVEALADPLLA